MKHPLIIATLLAALLLPTGCANKKQVARKTVRAPKTEQTVTPGERNKRKRDAERYRQSAAERARQAEEQRRQDSIVAAEQAAIELQLELERQEAERQRRADSIAQAEAARRAMVQTMNIQRMTVTMNIQGKQITTPASMRWQRGTGAVISIQPFAGIEMFRMELDAQYLTIIDKINRRYTRMSYDDMAQMGAATTPEHIDTWIDKNILEHRNEPQLVLQASRAGINGSAVIYTASMQTDVQVNLRPTNVESYRQVTLEQMAGGF